MNKIFSAWGSRFNTREQTHFAKRLAFLTASGVTLIESLKIINNQNKSKSKEKIYNKIIDDVSNGQFLSTSMRRMSSVFGDFAVNIIQVGEASGILSQNLNYLADELKKKDDLKRKVRSALIYPVFITISIVGITVLLTSYIFPKLLPIFQSIHVKLPLSTRILIFSSNFFREYWWLIFLGVIILIFVTTKVWKKSESFRLFFHILFLRIPILGGIIRSYSMANFSRTLGLLLKSGVPITNALSITAETTSNLAYRKEFKKLSKKVASGERISRCLAESKDIIPDISIQMIAVGETSGNLGEVLLYLALLYEGEVDEETKNFGSAIEPVLMIGMGIIVGFVAVSIISPIYEVTQNLRPGM